MIHSPLGALHLIAALAAVILGAIVFRSRKATRWHRRVGYGYAATMLATNVSALCIFGLSGTFNMLHGFAILSLSSLAFGMMPVLRGRPEGIRFDQHLKFMSWSYIGLIAALVAESATRIGMPILVANGYTPRPWFWALVGLASFLVAGVGALILRRQEPGLQRYRPRPRANRGETVDAASS
ncbi:DUF2306 domain-containing protein [Ahniella affigens]|uniref:DUF2306 domain-containing protein n=1 Tax=Ahniella affigens TaxID=2021234 RepID=UPI001472EEE5|nr:DUF2306 domain-containing protein [Ahniella affigens]